MVAFFNYIFEILSSARTLSSTTVVDVAPPADALPVIETRKGSSTRLIKARSITASAMVVATPKITPTQRIRLTDYSWLSGFIAVF
jgi:hypothetical protein